MKHKKNDNFVRCFTCYAPDWLIPIYKQVQAVEAQVLHNSNWCKQLINLNFKTKNKKGKLVDKPRNTLWTEVKQIIGYNPLTGKVPNAAWYFRIMAADLLALVKSHQQQVLIYQLLQANNFIINKTLRHTLTKNNLYPTNIELSNLVKAKQIPLLPEHNTLVLNYAFADKQMFTMDSHLKCNFQVYSSKYAKKHNIDAWQSFKIYIPTYIRKHIIKIAKPNFYLNDSGFHCVIPYFVESSQHPTYSNILGVDLGKVKAYSATMVTPDGKVSNEFIPSKYLMRLMNKLQKINKQRDNDYHKLQTVKPYLTNNKCDNLVNKQNRRQIDYDNCRHKASRLRTQIEWLMANELVAIALKTKCNTIHVENLTWVNNMGGKWDFSQINTYLQYISELNGITVVSVNPKYTSKEHPLTKELGLPEKRNIIFADLTIDRDQLAGLNIAIRKTKIKPNKVIRRQVTRGSHVSRRQLNYLYKKSYNLVNAKKNYIVTFLGNQVKANYAFTITKITKNICNNIDNNLYFDTKI